MPMTAREWAALVARGKRRLSDKHEVGRVRSVDENRKRLSAGDTTVTEKERLQQARALKQEIYQLEMKIDDFRLGESEHPMGLPAYEARLGVLKKQLAELGA